MSSLQNKLIPTKKAGILARLKVWVSMLFCHDVNISCMKTVCLFLHYLEQIHWCQLMYANALKLPVPLMWLAHSQRTELRYQEMNHWTSQSIFFLNYISNLSRRLKTQLVFLCFTHYCTFMMHMAEDTPDAIPELCSSYTSKHQQASFHQHQ